MVFEPRCRPLQNIEAKVKITKKVTGQDIEKADIQRFWTG
jgi:hypothetical protein